MRFILKKFKDGTHYLGADADDVEVSEVYGLAAFNTMHNITMMASLSMDKAWIDPDAVSAKSALIAVADHLRGLIESAAVTMRCPMGDKVEHGTGVRCVIVEHVDGGQPVRHEIPDDADLTDVGRVAFALTGLLGVDLNEACEQAKELLASGRLTFEGDPPITIETVAP